VRLAVFTWFEAGYNRQRRHSALNDVSPINFEKKQVMQTFSIQPIDTVIRLADPELWGDHFCAIQSATLESTVQSASIGKP
jgi:hypothetical protein